MKKSKLTFALLLLSLSSGLFSITESLAVVYHVANQMPCANDNNDGLRERCDGGPGAGPWRTIRRAEGVIAPGDTVIVYQGTYRENGEIHIRISGTPSAHIVFQAQGRVIVRAPAPRIAAFVINSPSGQPVQWVEVNGFEIEGEGLA